MSSNNADVSNKSIHGGPMNISSIPVSGDDDSFFNNSGSENFLQLQLKNDERLIFNSAVISPKFGENDVITHQISMKISNQPFSRNSNMNKKLS